MRLVTRRVITIMSRSRKSDKRRLISDDDVDAGGGGGGAGPGVGGGYGATGIEIGRE